jgi:hypothetical protein
MEKLSWGPLPIAALSLILFSVVLYVANLLQGTLLPPSEVTPLLSSRWWHLWSTTPILAPALFAMLVSVYRFAPRMLQELFDSGVLKRSRTAEDFRKRIQARLACRWIDVAVGLLCAGVFLVWLLIARRQQWANWLHPDPGRLSIVGVYWYALQCIAGYCLVRFAVFVIVLEIGIRSLFSSGSGNDLELQRFHPDNCGGLGPLSAFTLRLGFVLALMGVIIAIFFVNYISRHGLLVAIGQIGPPLALLAYLCVAPALFFLPVWPAHETMSVEKKNVLSTISASYEARFAEVESHLKSGESVSDGVEDLQAMLHLYERARSMPVWPFDYRTITRFFATVLAPIVVPVVVSLIVGWIG